MTNETFTFLLWLVNRVSGSNDYTCFLLFGVIDHSIVQPIRQFFLIATLALQSYFLFSDIPRLFSPHLSTVNGGKGHCFHPGFLFHYGKHKVPEKRKKDEE